MSIKKKLSFSKRTYSIYLHCKYTTGDKILRKVFRTGNSLGVSLPKDALDALGLQEGADVTVDLDKEGHQIVITPLEIPLSDAGVDEAFARQVAEFIEQYRPALEALSRE